MKSFTVLHVGFLSIFFSASALAQSINGTWHVKGFYQQADGETGIVALQQNSGTAQISATTFALQTTQLNFTQSVNLGQNGDVWSQKFTDLPNDDFSIAIRMIDEDTLVFAVALSEYSGSIHFSNFESAVGVMTKVPYQAPAPSVWSARYSSQALSVSENNLSDGIEAGVGNPVVAIDEHGTQVKAILKEDSDSFSVALSKGGSLASFNSSDTNRFLRWEDEVYQNYNLEENGALRMLDLGSGRLLFMESYITRFEAVEVPQSPDPAPESYQAISDAEVFVHLLESLSIGRIDRVIGSATVIRGGKKLPLLADSQIYEGDIEPPPIPSNAANLTPWTKSNFLAAEISNSQPTGVEI
jgi:hypothetical protein